MMRVTTDHYAAAFLGLAAALALGCGDSTAPAVPTTGALRITVSTESAAADVDPDGYTVSIDGGPDHVLRINDALTIPDLPKGDHVVQLGGVASNCSIGGSNPLSVYVPGPVAPATVPFVVSCVAKTGSIHISVATSGPDPDPDGYLVILTGVPGVGGGSIPANGTRDFYEVREGPVGVELTGMAGNCVVDGANPRTVNVAFGATVAVAFTIQCVAAGSIRVTTATTGAGLDPNGYELDIRLQGASSGTSTALLTNGTVTVSGLLGNYLLTLLDVMPNCDVVMPNPRLVAVAVGSPTIVTLDVTCAAPRELAFVSVDGANADISIVASNGSGAHRITTQLRSDLDPAWSPDGGRIAFTSERDGNREIYVMNADGTNPVRLTNVGAPDEQPAWSPDGRRIAFVSARDGNGEIYVMNADGTSPVRLTSNTAYDADPAWSPDGSRIAFSSDRDGSVGIWVMNADGSGATRLTTNTRGDRQPAWSPDGTRIAFSRASNNNSDIFIMKADGSGVTQLTRGVDNAADPAWSPDGRKIALGATPTNCGYYDYYCDPYPYVLVVSTDGIPYTALVSPASNPAWRP
jgi:Tol biopolymer transport system component